MLDQAITFWSYFRFCIAIIQTINVCFFGSPDERLRTNILLDRICYQTFLILVAKLLLILSSFDDFLIFALLQDLTELYLYRYVKDKQQYQIIIPIVTIGTTIILLAFHFFYEPYNHSHCFLIH